jgi:hypothetical protein
MLAAALAGFWPMSVTGVPAKSVGCREGQTALVRRHFCRVLSEEYLPDRATERHGDVQHLDPAGALLRIP